jgi:enoyl-CoA hydratase
MAGFETILYSKDESIGRITLNRPGALNAYNMRMRDELFEVLEAIRVDDDIRVVIVDGAADKAFCAGADLSEFLTAPSPTAARITRFERDVWGRFLQLPVPVIAALHGFVIGSGVEIALCCDIRIAAEDVRFRLPELSLGILPAAGGTQTLPRAVGISTAFEILLTGSWVDASEARRIGLVNRVVPRATLGSECLKIAERITGYDSRTVRLAKLAIVRGMDMSLQEGIELEQRLALILRNQARPAVSN